MLDLSSQEGRSWVVVGGDVLLKWTHNRLTHRGWGAVLYPTGVGAHSLGGGGGGRGRIHCLSYTGLVCTVGDTCQGPRLIVTHSVGQSHEQVNLKNDFMSVQCHPRYPCRPPSLPSPPPPPQLYKTQFVFKGVFTQSSGAV